MRVPFLTFSNFRTPYHLSDYLSDPTFHHFFKNHIFFAKKGPKTIKNTIFKFFKILDCLNGYLSDMRPSNYLILDKEALNFHLKSDSSFCHFLFVLLCPFLSKNFDEEPVESLFNCERSLHEDIKRAYIGLQMKFWDLCIQILMISLKKRTQYFFVLKLCLKISIYSYELR